MTRVIQIGARGSIFICLCDGEIKVQNCTSCHLLIDNKMVAPGETV